MDRTKLRKILLLVFGCPLALLLLINCITSYIPPTETYKKAPFQFEEIFNDRMAKYGLSIDVDSVNYSYGDGVSKTVPIQCEDGTKLSCTFYTTSDRRKSIIQHIAFRQELTCEKGETIYIEPILTFLLDEFDTATTLNKDVSLDPYSSVSYNEAIRICKEFVDGDEESTKFFISPDGSFGGAVTLKRAADENAYISISQLLWGG